MQSRDATLAKAAVPAGSAIGIVAKQHAKEIHDEPRQRIASAQAL